MKYLRLFETKYTRKIKYQYLNNADSVKLENFVNSIIKLDNIIMQIDNFNLEKYIDSSFDYQILYDEIFNEFNIYRKVDMFCWSGDFEGIINTPAIRNSLSDIFKKIIKKFKIKNKLDSQLIKLIDEFFNKNPKKCKALMYNWHDEMSNNVKNECGWVLDSQKYNL